MLTRRRVGNPASETDTVVPAWGGSTAPPREQTVKHSESIPLLSSHGSSSNLQSTARPQSSLPQSHTSCRDRTNEFTSVVKSVQSRQMSAPRTIQTRRGTSHNTAEFMSAARRIGKDSASTFAKLEQLSILSRRAAYESRDLIEQLSFVIKQDLCALNKQIAQVQQWLRGQRTTSNHQMAHSNAVVVTLQSKLAMMSTDFKLILEARNQSLKQQTKPADDTHSLQSKQSNATAGIGRVDSSQEIAISMDDNVWSPPPQQQQALRQREHEGRTETMTQIEQTIVELGGIFQQLAHMVHEQEEIVQRIDAHVDESSVNIEVAHSELVKYLRSVSANRSLFIKIFIVLIVFFTLFVIFLR